MQHLWIIKRYLELEKENTLICNNCDNLDRNTNTICVDIHILKHNYVNYTYIYIQLRVDF